MSGLSLGTPYPTALSHVDRPHHSPLCSCGLHPGTQCCGPCAHPRYMPGRCTAGVCGRRQPEGCGGQGRSADPGPLQVPSAGGCAVCCSPGVAVGALHSNSPCRSDKTSLPSLWWPQDRSHTGSPLTPHHQEPRLLQDHSPVPGFPLLASPQSPHPLLLLG